MAIAQSLGSSKLSTYGLARILRRVVTAGAFLFGFDSASAQVIGWSHPAVPPPYGVFSIGTSASGVETGRSIAIDASSNVYVYGMFAGTADFDPSGGTTTATANGTSSDLFVAKYNAFGALQWVARGGVANSGDNASGNVGAIRTDGTNVYVVGSLAVTGAGATFTPAAGGCTCTEPMNGTTTRGFVAKLDAATGTWQWVNSFGGIGNTLNGGHGVALDPSGNVYVVGQANGNFTLGALPAISTTDAQVFFARLNSAGIWQWATTGGGTGNDAAGQSGGGIAYNINLGRVIASGSYNSSTVSFGGIGIPNSTTNDIFLTELNPATGGFLSAFGLGGPGGADECAGIVYDPYTHDVFLAGQMSGSLSLPGTGALAQASAGNDVFVGRFTPNATPANGVFNWAKSFGAAGADRAYDIAVNGLGRIYFTGWFSGSGSVNFGGGGATQVTSTGTGNEIFAACLTTNGTGIWAVQGADNAATLDQGRGIAATFDSTGTVWATGQFNTGPVSWTPSSLGNTITLTNAGGASGSDVWVGKIYGGPALSSTGSQVNLTCNGVCSGSATVVASGGVAPYTYSWSPSGGSGATASSLCASSYTCTITDSVSASITRSFAVTQPTAISVSVLSQTNVLCNGGSNGAASINVPTGGAGSYTYNWTPGNPTGDGTVSVTGLTAGTWTCTVTDANSCTKTQTFNITQPAAISVTVASQANVSCNGGSNGAASINVPTGGAGGYTYNWTPGNPTGDGTVSVTGLTVGTWTCTVTDVNSCTATQTFNITQPTALSLGAFSQTNVSCNGGGNGAASVTPATGGAGGYSYNWTPGNPTGDGTVSVTGLAAGTWTCTVTDTNSCTKTQTFNVTQPTALGGSTSVTPPANTISCDGSATVTPTGGTPTYSVVWTPGGATGVTATGLCEGTYTATITDQNGCTFPVPAVLVAPTVDTAGWTFDAPVSGGTVLGGLSFTPTASFHNNGVAAVSNVPVRFRIVGPSPSPAVVYNQTGTAASIAGSGTTQVVFPATTIAVMGTYTMYARTEWPGDATPANDEASATLLAAVIGSVADGHGPSAPLRISHNPIDRAKLDLLWGASCGAAATDYAIYEGALGTFGAHSPSGGCTTSGGFSYPAFVPIAGDAYYLVVPQETRGEGSYGRRSDSAEIAPSGSPCHTPHLTAACP